MLRDRAMKKSFTTYITPPADLYETQDSYMIFLDMPGVSKDDLNVKVIDNRLIVQGKFEIEKPKDSEVLFNEIEKGEYRREFILSGDVDRNKIEAKLVNGVLTLTLAKREESKEIEIKIN